MLRSLFLRRKTSNLCASPPFQAVLCQAGTVCIDPARWCLAIWHLTVTLSLPVHLFIYCVVLWFTAETIHHRTCPASRQDSCSTLGAR